MSASASVLGPQGPFARDLDWFAVRDCQMEMADAIESAIDTEQIALLESGTGTGKTFAYLVPPLLSGKKTVISTRTKHLQEQLFQKDIPVVCEVLDLKPNVRLLKGRSNYLCLLRHEHAQKNPDLLGFSRKFDRVYNWVMEHDDGDISEYGLSAEEHRQMTATSRTCVGRDCEFWNPCFANRARQDARQADVLVINHNLLSLEMARGGSEDDRSTIHGFEVVIVDEAHRFPEIACESLGVTVSKERLEEFCTNLESVSKLGDLDVRLVASITSSLTDVAERLSRELSAESGEDKGAAYTAMSLERFEEYRNLVQGYRKIVQILDNAVQQLEPFIESSREIEMCRDMALNIIEDANQIFERDNVEVASWCETTRRGFSLNRLPLQPGKVFGPAITEFPGSWIFTSATIAVGDDFSLFESNMGFSDSIHDRWESPFDFENQTLLYFPANMPLPVAATRKEFDRRVAEVVEEIVPLTHGRVLALFTSVASMKSARDYLAERIDYTLLCQYERSNAQLLEDFKQDGNAVLLGTMGFWEGVDIKGDALACVIIDKLPFAPFDNPKENARRELMESNEESFFFDWQIPNAVLTLKQGSGRLIRDVSDRGMLVLCDPRINQKSYGRTFLDSLPPMPRTDSLKRVSEFFSR